MVGKTKIAIIGGSSGDILVSTCKKLGYYSILICGDETNRGYGAADENYLIDLVEKEKIVNIIKHNADCLLLGTGHALAHDIAKSVYDLGIVTSINPYKAEYGKNKILTYDFIRKIGFKTPDYFIINDLEQLNRIDMSLPCVVKSEDDSVKTAKALTKEHLYQLVDENLLNGSRAIVESFIDGVEYTIPIVSDGETYVPLTDALKMRDISKIAVAKLRNFTSLDEKYDRFELLDKNLINNIAYITTEITKKMELVGVPRYDLIVDSKKNIYILEVNEVSVSRNGEGHYPWEEVGIDYAKEMIQNTVKLLKNRHKE
ncbi:ATP-grasp domain-containing protein [Tissierella sp.]|uniref:ATP-grasp domain-containing protein n=1 Tax=Tissierella sp. TaxID=41274 RepID=UPI002865F827|nr:ATP-grasp domain-containing protein [Tissierella sp.]MDR7857547.1 ATP-grasp domain-containing protein [Tissierella sp.]